MGNLVLLEESANSALGNKPHAAKIAAYTAAEVPFDVVLQKSTTWGPKEIKSRTDLLAKLSYEEIFKI